MKSTPPKKWLNAEFNAKTAGAAIRFLQSGQSVVLVDPAWSVTRRLELEWTAHLSAPSETVPEFWIATGGSSGTTRFARHTLETLQAAAAGYLEFFPEPYKAICCLPMWHVSGWMQVMRAKVGSGEWVSADYKTWLNGQFPLTDPRDWTVSLVPTQLLRLIDEPVAMEWLQRCRRILIGGAALSEHLWQRALEAQLPLVPCYGMTETAAMVTALREGEFLSGVRGCGKPLPHVALQIAESGRIGIRSASVCLGYCPGEEIERNPFWTGDTGVVDIDGNLTITGRLDRVINTGGEKVDPMRIESLVQQRFPTVRAHVFAVPDQKWGQRVIAAIETLDTISIDTLDEWARKDLEAPWRPKRWLIVERLPFTQAGKVDVEQLRSIASL